MQDTTAHGSPINSPANPESAAKPEPHPLAPKTKGEDEGLLAQIQQLNDELNRRRAGELELIKWRDEALQRWEAESAHAKAIEASLRDGMETSYKLFRQTVKTAQACGAENVVQKDKIRELRARLSAVVQAAAGL